MCPGKEPAYTRETPLSEHPRLEVILLSLLKPMSFKLTTVKCDLISISLNMYSDQFPSLVLEDCVWFFFFLFSLTGNSIEKTFHHEETKRKKVEMWLSTVIRWEREGKGRLDKLWDPYEIHTFPSQRHICSIWLVTSNWTKGGHLTWDG